MENKVHQRIERACAEGEDVIEAAENLRRQLHRSSKPGDAERERTLRAMVKDVNTSMEPIRSLVARSLHAEPQWPEKLEDRLRQVSKDLQYQRRALKKMLRDWP